MSILTIQNVIDDSMQGRSHRRVDETKRIRMDRSHVLRATMGLLVNVDTRQLLCSVATGDNFHKKKKQLLFDNLLSVALSSKQINKTDTKVIILLK